MVFSWWVICSFFWDNFWNYPFNSWSNLLVAGMIYVLVLLMTFLPMHSRVLITSESSEPKFCIHLSWISVLCKVIFELKKVGLFLIIYCGDLSRLVTLETHESSWLRKLTLSLYKETWDMSRRVGVSICWGFIAFSWVSLYEQYNSKLRSLT